MKKFTLGLALCTLTVLFGSSLFAQGNRIPLNWKGMTVKVTETYGNNNTKPLRGAKVSIDITEKYRAVLDSLQKIYPVLRLPQQRTSQTRGAMFSKLPPSSVVGPYLVKVNPKPNDIKNEYTCAERSGKDEGRQVRMGGGGPNKLVNFNFKCEKTDIKNEFNRRKKGGFDLSVKLQESGGTRGNGYWVWIYDKNNRRVKKVRTGGSATAVFKALDPGLNPYRIEVRRLNKLVHESKYEMPEENATYTIDLNT